MVTHINPSAARVEPEVVVGSATPSKPVSAGKGGARFRVMPLTMTMLGLLLVLKMNDVFFSVRELRGHLVSNALAAEEKKEEVAASNDAAAGEGNASAKAEDGQGKKEVPASQLSNSEIKTLKKLEEQTKYNQIELDLLQNLSKRRDELDAREKELDIKTKVLESTEQRINGRIEEMKTLQVDVKRLIDSYKAQQDTDVRSLVKIYENMKPVDAAKIFDELDMPILLSVVDKMSERKVAPVLAAMTPRRAKEVTEELADLRKSKALPANAESATR